MRKSVMLSVTLLLGGCAASVPPAPVGGPGPVPARVETPQPEPKPRQAAQPRPSPRPQAVRIDNTSIESFRASWQRLRASLSPTQQANLNDAVMKLTFSGYGGTNIPANLRSSPIVPEMVRDRIAGLTYSEIIALSP
jgi:hypothetical protein